MEDAIRRHEEEGRRRCETASQGDIFGGFEPQQQPIDLDAARQSVLDRLESFLSQQTGGDDLGLRLRGEQLAAGLRFVRIVEEGKYDLVVGNPPYQGTSKMEEDRYVKKHYPRGKADLYAAFLERGLQLVRPSLFSAFLNNGSRGGKGQQTEAVDRSSEVEAHQGRGAQLGLPLSSRPGAARTRGPSGCHGAAVKTSGSPGASRTPQRGFVEGRSDGATACVVGGEGPVWMVVDCVVTGGSAR